MSHVLGACVGGPGLPEQKGPSVPFDRAGNRVPSASVSAYDERKSSSDPSKQEPDETLGTCAQYQLPTAFFRIIRILRIGVVMIDALLHGHCVLLWKAWRHRRNKTDRAASHSSRRLLFDAGAHHLAQGTVRFHRVHLSESVLRFGSPI